MGQRNDFGTPDMTLPQVALSRGTEIKSVNVSVYTSVYASDRPAELKYDRESYEVSVLMAAGPFQA